MSETKQASISDYFVYGIYRSFEFVLKFLPLKLVCLIGKRMGDITYIIFKNRRKIVTRNLRIAFGEEISLEEIHRLTRQTFQHSVTNLIASFRTSSFTTDELRQRVEVDGIENIEVARAQGDGKNGIICLLCHMGNWELMAQLHTIVPSLTPPATLYRPLNNLLIDQLIQQRRGSEGTELFSRHDGFFKPIAHIKKGGSLGILADQNAGASGLATPFFGKLTSMTHLPSIIHRRTGAAIVPMSMATTSLGKWKVTIHPPIHIPTEQKTNTQFITNLCAKAYETIMRANPADVLWMHGYWKIGRKRPLLIAGLQKNKKGLQRSLATKPLRVIVHTGSATSENQEMIDQLERLKNYRPDIHLTVVGKQQITPSIDHFIPLTAPETELVQTLQQYDASLPQPIDCTIDFTNDSSGTHLFELAEFSHILAITGKYLTEMTIRHFSKIDHPTLSDFVDSLGIKN